ncbi:hypothetical protein [Streptomyces sp. NPDC053720]
MPCSNSMTIPVTWIRRTTKTGSNCFTDSELVPDTNPLGPLRQC